MPEPTSTVDGLRHRNRCIISDIEEQWESGAKRLRPSPPIQSELRALPVAHQMFGPKFKQVLDLVEAFSKLRTPTGRAGKDIPRANVFRPNKLGPKRVPWLVPPPDPLQEQSHIHLPRV